MTDSILRSPEDRQRIAFERIKPILAANLWTGGAEIALQSNLESLGWGDALDRLDATCAIERAYAIEIEDHEIAELATVADLVALVIGKVG